MVYGFRSERRWFLHHAANWAFSPAMRMFVCLLLIFVGFPLKLCAAISPEAVAVLYNSAVPESRKLADLYRISRDIPQENLIALDMPTTADISRAEYEKWILAPLRSEFERRAWWERQVDKAGVIVPTVNRIQVLVVMRGVPLRINAKPLPEGMSPAPLDPQNPVAGHDEASVDSELAMFGVENLPTDGILKNKFYQSAVAFSEAKMPFLVLTSRIDAPTFATCERMIRDAVEVEKTGLWGRAYVDIANKFPQGDQWLAAVAKASDAAGIPTVVDSYHDTLPKNYPMTDASLYFGWYDGNVSGPFLNPRFQFRQGAIAVHLHSFSAQQLADGTKNWCGPLLEKGAAATVGNVFEPYLHLTHDFGILHQKLLDGSTWVEACWSAMPVTSWQGVVLGDPLYRPFKRFDGTGVMQDQDIEFRALRAAVLEWKLDAQVRQNQLEKAAERMKSGVIAEAVALDRLQRKDFGGAATAFRTAKTYYPKIDDKLRQDFQIISIDRAGDRKDLAVRGLRDAQTLYSGIPEADALKGWLDILDPPAPPPADPTKAPPVKQP
jgi:uncharacterized protein (TIGR03790 family)